MKLFIPIAAAQVANLAAPDESRPVLSAVCVDLDHSIIVAADGFRMMVLNHEVTYELDPGESIPKGQLLIPAKAIKLIARRAKKDVETIETEITGAAIKLSVWGKTGFEETITTNVIDGTYPDIKNIVPSDAPSDRFYLDPDFIISTVESMKRAGAHCIRIERFPRSNSSIVLSGSSSDDPRQITAVVMPMVYGSSLSKDKTSELGEIVPDVARDTEERAA